MKETKNKVVLLIDDRTNRQVDFTRDTSIDLKQYEDIIDNVTGDDYHKLVERFSKQDINLNYAVIIVHRSAFGESQINILDKLKEYCEKTKTKLVFFSGGISSTFYLNNTFEFLLVNSKILYSENLKLFLDDCRKDEINILEIGYGTKWKLNILLNTLEKINKFIGNNASEEMVHFDDFRDDTEIWIIDGLISYRKPELRNGGVKMSDLKNLSFEISNQIKQQVVLHV